jgi:hypothetical protein
MFQIERLNPPQRHRRQAASSLGREEIHTPELVAWPATDDPDAHADPAAGNTGNTAAAIYRCKHCGAEGLTKSQQLDHGRRHARERKALSEA